MTELLAPLSDTLSATLWPAALAALAWGFVSIWLSPCHLAGVPLVVGYLAAAPQPQANRGTLIAGFAFGSLLSLVPLGAVTIALGRLAGDLGVSSNLLVALLCILAGLYLLDRLPGWNARGLPRSATRGPVAAVLLGMLFGVAATEAGLNLAEVLGFSILVIAGASQFTAIQLMTDNAPVFMVLLTSLAVNLRMAMYSAALAPHLGAAPTWQRAAIAYFMVDQSYAVSAQDYEKRPDQSLSEKLAYYAGACTPVCPQWYFATWLGAVLDFAVPITFLAIIAPIMRTLAHVAAAFVSVAAALGLAFLPAGTGLLIAAALAMATGAQVELWTHKRRALR